MKIKLSISNRLNFGELLPKETNYIEMILVKDIKERVDISQEEAKDIGLVSKVSDGKLLFNWSKEKETEKEIDFTDSEMEVINKQVDKLDKSNKITEANFDLIKIIKESK